MQMSDGTRARRRRPLVATAAAVLVAGLAVAGCGGDDDGEDEQAPTTTARTESTLSPDQQADADVLECLGPLPTDPNATVGGLEDCAPTSTTTAPTGTTLASAPGA